MRVEEIIDKVAALLMFVGWAIFMASAVGFPISTEWEAQYLIPLLFLGLIMMSSGVGIGFLFILFIPRKILEYEVW